jgi:hypothetical protein
MQDTLLLCQIAVGKVTLQGYRVAQQYVIVAGGLQERPLRYIFNEFEDMNNLWLELKGSGEAQIIQKLLSRPEGSQGVSKPKRREVGNGGNNSSSYPSFERPPQPQPRPRPTASPDRPPPPRKPR